MTVAFVLGWLWFSSGGYQLVFFIVRDFVGNFSTLVES